jgi:hypothetical protein
MFSSKPFCYRDFQARKKSWSSSLFLRTNKLYCGTCCVSFSAIFNNKKERCAHAYTVRRIVGRRRHAAATGAGLEPELSSGADHEQQHVLPHVLHEHAQSEGHDLQGA